MSNRITLRIFIAVLAVSIGPSLASAQVLDHLKCFRMKDQRGQTNIHYTLTLTPAAGSPFTTETGCTVRSRARTICVPVAKSAISPSPLPTPAGPPAEVHVCYDARCPREQDVTVNVLDQLGGTGPVLVRQHAQRRQLCVPAPSGPPPVFCGNGVLDPGEECDPPDVHNCHDLGFCLDCHCINPTFTITTTTTSTSTTITTSTTIPPECGNGVIESGEACDGDGTGASCTAAGGCEPPGEPNECQCCSIEQHGCSPADPCCPGLNCEIHTLPGASGFCTSSSCGAFGSICAPIGLPCCQGMVCFPRAPDFGECCVLQGGTCMPFSFNDCCTGMCNPITLVCE